MTIYRDVERFANRATKKTLIEKATTPDLGTNIIPHARYTSAEFGQQQWDKV